MQPAGKPPNGIEHYLTGNPQITHFKTVYRRHTDFCRIECRGGSHQRNNMTIFGIPTKLEMDILNKVMLVHSDPNFDVGKAIESIEMVINDLVVDKITLIDHDVDTKIVRSPIEGTKILPWFWFHLMGTSLPLCAITNSVVNMIVRWKSKPHSLQSYISGFSLGEEEKRRYGVVAHEQLIQSRQPTITCTSFATGEFNDNVVWMPIRERHQLFEFNDSVITLFCCLKRIFGQIDRNIRNRIVAEWAQNQRAPKRRFELKLNGWDGPTKAIRFLLFDRNHQKINCGGIYNASLVQGGGAIVARIPGCSLTDDNIWPFAINPKEHQPSGHIMNLHTSTLIVECDARVNHIAVQGIKYNVLAILENKVTLGGSGSLYEPL